MPNKVLTIMIISTFIIISGCGLSGQSMPDNEYFMKPSYDIKKINEDLEKCHQKYVSADISVERSYTNMARSAFCMRDKGYTTVDGPINDPGCSAYKQQYGKVLPICAAHGVY